MNTCGTCGHFQPHPDGNGRTDGKCYSQPPQFAGLVARGLPESRFMGPKWSRPIVDAADKACGDWEVG